MSNPNTDRDERVRQIERWLMLHTPQNSDPYASLSRAFSEIRYLLSLLDSQVETFVGPCVGCGHNNYDAERKECKQRWMEGRMSVVCGCPCAKHNSLERAATRMRDRCVTKVKELMTKWEHTDTQEMSSAYAGAMIDGGNEIVTTLKSLTLEGEQEK